MKMHKLTTAQANFDLALLNAEAESFSSGDFYLWLRDKGVPSEVAIRLKNLVDVTVEISGRIVNIGKIILIRIVEFVKLHENLAVGIAIGAAIGVLVGMVPLLGNFLAPIAAAIGMSVGAIAGHRMDKFERGQVGHPNERVPEIASDVIEIAKDFFKLLIDIFNIILDEQHFRGI